MRIRSVLGMLLFCIVPSALRAQGTCPALEAGSTIRLNSTPETSYTLPARIQPSDTIFRLGGLTFRCSDVKRVQLRTGSVSRGRSALRLAGFGAVAGAVVGAGLGYAEGGSGLFSQRGMMLLAGASLGGIGALGGGVIGFLMPESRWEEVPVPPQRSRASAEGPRISPAGRGGVRLSYTLPI